MAGVAGVAVCGGCGLVVEEEDEEEERGETEEGMDIASGWSWSCS